MSKVSEILDSRYKAKTLRASVTDVPLGSDGRSVGYVVATVGGVGGVQVMVDPDAMPYGISDTLDVQAYGTPANTTYYAIRRVAGARPVSLVTQFQNDTTITGYGDSGDTSISVPYYGGEILLGNALTGPNTRIGSGSLKLNDGTTSVIELATSTSSVRVGGSTATSHNTYVTPTAVQLRDGTTVRAELSASNVRVGGSTAADHNFYATPTTVQLRDGTTVRVELSASAVRVGGSTTTDHNLYAAPAVIQLRQGSTMRVELAASAVQVGGSGATDPNTYITPTSIALRTGSTTHVNLDSSGSGYVANANVNWDPGGNFHIQGSASIAGWVVTACSLTAGTGGSLVGIDTSGGSTPALYAGGDPGTAPARIYRDGRLYASSACITGQINATTGCLGTLIVTGSITTPNYVSNVSGWGIGSDGNAEFANANVRGELHSTVWVKDLIDAHAGTMVVGKSAGKLSHNFLYSLLYCPYDGNAPYTTDFSGSPDGLAGQVATVAGGVIYRPGKFGKAVQIAEATTNLMPNPSLETNGTGMTLAVNCGVSRSAEEALYGTYSLKAVGTGGLMQMGQADAEAIAVSAATIYAFSLCLYTAVAGKNALIYIIEYTADGVYITEGAAGSALAIPGSKWTRISGTRTLNASTGKVAFRLLWDGAAGNIIYADAWQCEQRAYVSPYCDGSLGPGHSWSGTAHGSTSSRTAASLSYPIAGNLQHDAGSISLWVRPGCLWSDANWSPSGTGSFFWGYGDSRRFIRRFYSVDTGYLQFVVQGSGVFDYVYSHAFSADNDDWTHLALTWDKNAGTAAAYVNGVQVDATAALTLSTTAFADTTFTLGNLGYANCLIDDLVILDRAMTAAEVAALYTSTIPLANTLIANDSPAGGWLFDTNDIVRLMGERDTGVGDSWYKVTRTASTNIYTVGALLSGSTGDYQTGIPILDYGVSGCGMLSMTAELSGAPYYDVLTHTGSPWSTTALRARLGNLSGVIDTTLNPTGYGLYTTNGYFTGALKAISGCLVDLFLTGSLGIASTGGIFQGTGTFASPCTALKIYNSGGMGVLETWNGRTKQVYFGTNGLLYAGGGNVMLSSSGISVPSTHDFAESSCYRILRDGAGMDGGIYGVHTDADHIHSTYLVASEVAGEHAFSGVTAYGASGKDAQVSLMASVKGAGDTMLSVVWDDVLGSYISYGACHHRFATGYLSTLEGMHIGGTSDPGTDNLLVDNNATITGCTYTAGLHVGGTSNPGNDNLIVDGLTTLTGGVGVGVAGTATWGGFQGLLQSTDTSVAFGADTNVYVNSNCYWDNAAGTWKRATADFCSSYYQFKGQHYFTVAASGTADSVITWTDAVNIDNLGTINWGGAARGLTDAFFRLGTCLSGGHGFYWGNSSNGLVIGDYANGWPGADSAMVMGKLGVGASPIAKMDVNGTARVIGAADPTSGIGLELAHTGGISYISSYNRDAPAGYKTLKIQTGACPLYRVNNNVHFDDSSDELLKEAITPLSGALEKLGRIHPIAYKLNDTYFGRMKDIPDAAVRARVYHGFSAQEYGTVFPDSVHRDDDGYLSLNTSNIHAWTVAAVQELAAIIAEKDARVAALEGRLRALEQR